MLASKFSPFSQEEATKQECICLSGPETMPGFGSQAALLSSRLELSRQGEKEPDRAIKKGARKRMLEVLTYPEPLRA
jgi:hypothetical protein